MRKLELNINGTNLIAWMAEQNGEQLVAVRPICDALGIDPRRQAKKLQSDVRFSWRHMSATGSDGKRYEMLCIPVCQLSGWLYGINSKKVKAETAPQLLAFQQQLQGVLWAYTKGELTFELVADFKRTIEVLCNRLQYLEGRVDHLEQENQQLKEGHGYMATSAAYGMLAAKKTKRARAESLIH